MERASVNGVVGTTAAASTEDSKVVPIEEICEENKRRVKGRNPQACNMWKRDGGNYGR